MNARKKPRVVYWNVGPSHYVAGRLNAVARRGNIDIQAWFNLRRVPERNWDLDQDQWEFPARVVQSSAVLGRPLQTGCSELANVMPDLVVCGYDSASRSLGALAASAAGVRVGFRVLPSFRAWFRPTVTREVAKHLLYRVADGVKVSGKMAAATAMRYGMAADRVFVVRQSIDRDHYGDALRMRSNVGELLRQELQLQGVVFIYVGRLWERKGLDYLLEAYGRLTRRPVDVSLLIVGNGPDEARYRKAAENVRNVVFAGFVQPRDLPRYYSAADVMVFPTLGDPFGLVVEEAMAAGLPVISTEAAGEIQDRVPDGGAGYIVPPADVAALETRMFALASEPRVRRTMSEVASNLSSIVPHDTYARDFETFVDGIMSKPRRCSISSRLARAIGRIAMTLETPTRQSMAASFIPIGMQPPVVGGSTPAGGEIRRQM